MFSPYLIVVIAGAIGHFRELRKEPIFLLAVGWFIAHYLVIAQFPKWWGSHGFGGRYISDAMPALVVVTALLYKASLNTRANIRQELRKAMAALFLVFGLFSIWVHSYQGIYNHWAVLWNHSLDHARTPQRLLLDWRYPQFLATGEMIASMSLEYFGGGTHEAFIDREKQEVVVYELHPETAKAFLERGIFFGTRRLYDRAIADFNDALGFSPDMADAYYYRGAAYINKGENALACDDWEKACGLGNCKGIEYAEPKGYCKE